MDSVAGCERLFLFEVSFYQQLSDRSCRGFFF
jgi:hypothetical protein